jgi:hypothetical protein
VERRRAMKKDTMMDESEQKREKLGDSPRMSRRQDIIDMDVDKMEEEI